MATTRPPTPHPSPPSPLPPPLLSTPTLQPSPLTSPPSSHTCHAYCLGGPPLPPAQVATTGVTYVSVGALTHSVMALDISLNILTS